MSWPRRSCCSMGSRERCGAWLRRPRPRRRPRDGRGRAFIAVAAGAGFVSRVHLRFGKLVVADRLGLDIFFADHFRHGVERGDSVVKIRDVQEARLRQTDIDKRSLHPGQHARDLALIDVARQPNLAIALEVEFGQFVILEQRHPHLQCGRVNCDFSFHRWTLYSGKSDVIACGRAIAGSCRAGVASDRENTRIQWDIVLPFASTTWPRSYEARPTSASKLD